LVAFSGSGSAPFYLWFTTDNRFFGSTSDWSSLIQKGYEKSVDALYGIQKQFENKFYTGLAEQLTQKTAAGIAIKNVTVFNTETGDTSPHQTVLVRGDKIEKLGNTNGVIIPAGYKIINGKGKFLMPGLWDVHCHFSKDQGPLMLAQGVTNIRDMGNGPELLNVRDEINKDSLLGPNVTVISGFIDKAGEMAGPTGALINTHKEGLKAEQDYKNKGYDQIKLYSSIEPGWVKPLADNAHRLGMRVCGHVPAFMTASEAIDAGYDEVTHINMLFLNFFGDTVDTRNMTRLTLPGRLGYGIDIKGPAVQTFIQQLKDKHIVLDPTMSAFEDIFTDLPGKVSKKYAPITPYLPAEIKRQTMNGSYLDADSLVDTYHKSFENMKKMLKELYSSGITIMAGTDGGILQHELEIYSQADIPNADVLRMATYWPAKVLGRYAMLGSITENKLANFILVDGNPLKNLQDIRNVYLTVKEGKFYSPKAIYASFGWGYYY
jgi:imidazolonepropionase-like amidohydrolase